MEELSLPVDDKDLEIASIKAQQEAEEKFERGKFGGQVGPLREALQAAIEKELRWGGLCFVLAAAAGLDWMTTHSSA